MDHPLRRLSWVTLNTMSSKATLIHCPAMAGKGVQNVVTARLEEIQSDKFYVSTTLSGSILAALLHVSLTV